MAVAEADEFSDVDPQRLAQGIERLAAAWSIHADGSASTTDEFTDDDLSLDRSIATSDVTTRWNDKVSILAQTVDPNRYPDDILVGMGVDGLLGAIRKRRRQY